MNQRPRLDVLQQARPRTLTSALPTSLGCPRPAHVCLSTCMCLPKAKAIQSPGPISGLSAPARPSAALSDGEQRLSEASGFPFPSQPMSHFPSFLRLSLSFSLFLLLTF